MKHSIIILTITLLTAVGCIAQEDIVTTSQINTEADLLDFYRQYSKFTDPGEYAYLYENLPDSLEAICQIVRSQFIHPHAQRQIVHEHFPKERWDESAKYPTVQSMLEGLVSHNASGLVNDRAPEERLVLGCRHNALLLASILKYRGIPARLRAGHATYLIPEFHTSHTICEVWNEDEYRWMLVDAPVYKIDFSEDEFDFSFEAWMQLQNKEIDPDKYGIPRRYSGLVSITSKVCWDLSSILGTEYPIFQYAPILDDVMENNTLSSDQIVILNRVSELMQSIDAEDISKLQDIYNNTPEIQMTQIFQRK